MGLDIAIYKDYYISKSEEYWDFRAYVADDSWLHKIKNLKNNYKYKGTYISTDISYSYSSHNRFREYLIKVLSRFELLDDDNKINWIAVIDKYDMDFYEFIDFSDCEGCLDHEVSEKLYDEFYKNLDKAVEFSDIIDDKYFIKCYVNWMKIFEIAKDNGVVVFR